LPLLFFNYGDSDGLLGVFALIVGVALFIARHQVKFAIDLAARIGVDHPADLAKERLVEAEAIPPNQELLGDRFESVGQKGSLELALDIALKKVIHREDVAELKNGMNHPEIKSIEIVGQAIVSEFGAAIQRPCFAHEAEIEQAGESVIKIPRALVAEKGFEIPLFFFPGGQAVHEDAGIGDFPILFARPIDDFLFKRGKLAKQEIFDVRFQIFRGIDLTEEIRSPAKDGIKTNRLIAASIRQHFCRIVIIKGG
jgi:hypothetical protein